MTGTHEAKPQSTQPFAVQRHEEEGGDVQAHEEAGSEGPVQAHEEEGGEGPVQAKVAPIMSHWAEGSSPVQKDGDEDVQQKATAKSTNDVHAAAKAGTSGSGSALPHADAIQRSFGANHDISNIQHYSGGAAEAANKSMGAEAFAVGNKVASKGGMSLHTAAHEAAHVVQQRAGAVQLAGGVGKAGDRYEQHADAVADRVVQGKPAGDLLDQMTGAKETGAVQKQEAEGEDVQQRATKKAVSGKAMKRLGAAREAIEHTKSVIAFGAGNQAEALKATNFNSYFRMKAMRDPSCWEMTPSARRLAAQDPTALTAAKADLAQGGNCGEHAVVAFDYLRAKGTGDPIAVAAKSGLDHAFVLMGDLSEGDEDIVVSDPWPTMATATTWGDHFAFTGDRQQIERSYTATSDGNSAKEAIKAGLKLSAKGLQMINSKMSDEETDKEIDKSMGGWIWGHEDAAAQGKKHEYVERRSPRAGSTGAGH